MADPVVSTTLYAVTRGFLTFDDYEPTSRWIASYRLRIHATKQAMDAEVYALDALRLFSELSIPRVNIEEAKQLGEDAYCRFEASIKPWMASMRKASRHDTHLDLFARWYIINAPERLKELGVDFGKIESVSRFRG